MSYILAGFAIAAPLWLVIASLRGRIRLQCCSGAGSAENDLRMRRAYEEEVKEK